MFTLEIYKQRRLELSKKVGTGIIVFIGNDEQGLNYEDNSFRFRQDSTFLYYFGISQNNISAIIDIDNNCQIIFGDELTIDSIIWMGSQESLKEKAERSGILDTRPSSELYKYIQKNQNRIIHTIPYYRAEHRIKLSEILNIPINEITPSIELIKAIVSQRSYKSSEEIIEIEKACNITADMHIIAIKTLHSGMKECEIVAKMEEIVTASNAELSFPTIATINGQTLHNHFHGNTTKEGQLFLIDAGAETQMGYAGDMSSTIPVSKKFTSRQKEIYDIQNAMHKGSVAALKPGVRFEEIYDLSAKIMVEHFKSLGLMKGDTDEAVKEGAFALFYPHGLGHMMGLDVHDMENLGENWVGYNGKEKSKKFGRKSLRLARELEVGFVHTIEPGIYFIPELIDLWKSQNKFSEFINYEKVETYKDFGGIRNEEDYLITPTGARLLGKKIPLTTEEVEAIR